MRLIALMLLFLAFLALPARAAQASIQVLSTPDRLTDLTAGPDGVMWGLEYHDVPEHQPSIRVVRLDAAGVISRVGLAANLRPLDSNGSLHPLSDGSMGLFVQRMGAWTDTGQTVASLELMRFAAGSGAVVRTSDLPAEASAASGVAVAPDGAVWFARSCADELDRIGAHGAIARVRLPALGCGRDALGREEGAGLAFDVSGALWLVNRCMGRVDRVALDGGVREWWTPRITCPYREFELPEATPAKIVLDPRGGIAFDFFKPTPGNTQGRHARGTRFPERGAGLFTPDGGLWFGHGGGAERHDGDDVTALPGPHGVSDVSNLALTRAGEVAFVRAAYGGILDLGYRNSTYSLFVQPRLVTLGAQGSAASLDLPNGGADELLKLNASALVLGPDGALWDDETRLAGAEPYRAAARIVRVLPDGVGAPRPAVARVRRVLGRVRRTVWLQLSCGAELARFCSGTVRLARAALTQGAVPYTLAGGANGAVPLRLSDRAAFVLRGHGLTVTVIVRTKDGTETRQLVRLQAIVRRRPAA